MTHLTERELEFMKRIVEHDEYGEKGNLGNCPWSWAVCHTKADAAILGSLVKKDICYQNGRGKDASCGLTQLGKEEYVGHFGSEGTWE